MARWVADSKCSTIRWPSQPRGTRTVGLVPDVAEVVADRRVGGDVVEAGRHGHLPGVAPAGRRTTARSRPSPAGSSANRQRPFSACVRGWRCPGVEASVPPPSGSIGHVRAALRWPSRNRTALLSRPRSPRGGKRLPPVALPSSMAAADSLGGPMTNQSPRRRVGAAPTIYDVARDAGSPRRPCPGRSRGPGRVNAETAARIRAVAERIGYRTNPLARALPTGRDSDDRAGGHATSPTPSTSRSSAAPRPRPPRPATPCCSPTARSLARLEREAIDRAVPAVEGLVLGVSRMSDSAIRMAAKQRPRRDPQPGGRRTSRAWSPTTPRGMRRAVEHLGGARPRHHHLPRRAGGVLGRRDAVAGRCGRRGRARPARAPPRSLPADRRRRHRRRSTTCSGSSPRRPCSPTTTSSRSA